MYIVNYIYIVYMYTYMYTCVDFTCEGMYTVYNTLYIAHNVQCTLYTVQCLCNVECIDE